MSRWKELFKNHAIHATLDELRVLANTKFDDITADHQSEKRRFLKVVTAYENILKNLDPELTPFNSLDSLNNALRKNISTQMVPYRDSGNADNLINSNNNISDQLTQLSLLISIAKKAVSEKPLKGLGDSVDEFAKSIEAKKKTLEDEINDVSPIVEGQKTQLEELSNNINTKKQEIDSLITGWQEQHSNAQNKRDTDFVADQKVRTDTYAEWRKGIEEETKTSINGLVTKSTEKLENHQTEFDDSVSEYLATAEKKHQAILELYELVAGDSVGSGYLKSANDEKRQAGFWRGAAILFILATAGWTAYAYIADTSTVINESGVIEQLKFSWAKVLKAVSVTGVLLFGAVYSAKQSNVHRQGEKRARWFALEVKAIDPFISSLEKDDQKALKKQLSERLFGQQEHIQDKDPQVIDEHAFSLLVKGIIDILKAK